jgi:hypothetical protein
VGFVDLSVFLLHVHERADDPRDGDPKFPVHDVSLCARYDSELFYTTKIRI